MRDYETDLGYETPEGDSAALDLGDELEAFQEGDDLEGGDFAEDLEADLAGEDELDEFGEGDLADLETDFGDEDDFDSYAEDDLEDDADEDMLDEAIAYALSAESEDEFFKKLWRGMKKVGGAIGRGIKKVAPFVSRIAPFLPIPGASLIGTGARLISQLRAESDEDPIEAMELAAEAAKRTPAATPLVVGLISRRLTGNRGKTMPKAARKAVAKAVRQGVKALNRKTGPSGAQAAVQIAKRVRVQAHRSSPVQKAKIFRATAKKAAQRPAVAKALAKRTPMRVKAKARMLTTTTTTRLVRGGPTRSFTVPGPARVIIRPL